jgi:hypothetical protein
MTQERPGTATVIGQDGTVLRVRYREAELAARMVGFPPGFTLRPGERVVLADERSGLTARPLVRTVMAPVGRATLERDREVGVGDRNLVIQESTVFDFEPGKAEAPSEETTLWVVESEGADETDQVIAARSQRR